MKMIGVYDLNFDSKFLVWLVWVGLWWVFFFHLWRNNIVSLCSKVKKMSTFFLCNFLFDSAFSFLCFKAVLSFTYYFLCWSRVCLYMLTLLDFVCGFWRSFIITALPIYSSSHSASGPGQSLRLFLSQSVLLSDKTERLSPGLNASFLVALVTQRVLFASGYCKWRLATFACH